MPPITKRWLRSRVTKEFKYKLADEYVGSRLGIGYDKFLADGIQVIPPEVHAKCLTTLVQSRWDVPCSGCRSTPAIIIIRINDSGLVERCSNFAAIASGMFIAEASLFQREHSGEISLGDAVYHVYEAMRLGSAAPGVGEKFSLHIVSPPTSKSGRIRLQWTTEDYEKYMDKMLKKFGPKKTSGFKFRSRAVKLNKFTPSGVPIDQAVNLSK